MARLPTRRALDDAGRVRTFFGNGCPLDHERRNFRAARGVADQRSRADYCGRDRVRDRAAYQQAAGYRAAARAFALVDQALAGRLTDVPDTRTALAGCGRDGRDAGRRGLSRLALDPNLDEVHRRDSNRDGVGRFW